MLEVYSPCEEGGGVGGGERETIGLVAGPPPFLVFLEISLVITKNFLGWHFLLTLQVTSSGVCDRADSGDEIPSIHGSSSGSTRALCSNIKVQHENQRKNATENLQK